MPAFCCVTDCIDRYSHTGNISYHKFPLKKSALLEKWLEFIGRSKDWTPSRWSAVCCRHFATDAFSNLNGRKTLKKDAFPTITTYINQKKENKKICAKEVYMPPKSHVKHEARGNVEQRLHEVPTNTAISPINEFCCLCYNNNRFHLSVVCNSNIFRYIQKCLPMFNIQENALLHICRSCLEDIESLNRFIQRIVEGIRSQKVSKTNAISKSNERQLKIKQEPITRVKQEYTEQESDMYEEDFDYGCDESIEHDQDCDVEQKFPFNSLSSLNTKDIINNCDIMEIVNLDDPFINIIDDDGNTNLEGLDDQAPPLRTATLLNNRLLPQLISEEHNYVDVVRELKYEGQIRNVYKTEKNDSQDILNPQECMGDQTINENLNANAKDIPQSINKYDDNCRSLKPIVTSISNILDSSLQFPVNTNISTSKSLFVTSVRDVSTITEQPILKPYTKPNIVVLNESIVQSPHAFCLQTCCVCQSNFFSVQALTQHYTAVHNQVPMVTIPSANMIPQSNDNDVSIIKEGNLLNILNDSVDIEEFCKAIDLIENRDHNPNKNSKNITSKNYATLTQHPEQNEKLEPTLNTTFEDDLIHSKKINCSKELKQSDQKNIDTIINNESADNSIDTNKNNTIALMPKTDLKEPEHKPNSEATITNEFHYIPTCPNENKNISPASKNGTADIAQSGWIDKRNITTSTKFQVSKCPKKLISGLPVSKTCSTDLQQCEQEKSMEYTKTSNDFHDNFIGPRQNNIAAVMSKNSSIDLKVSEQNENINTITNNVKNDNDYEVFTDPRKHNTTLLVSKNCSIDLKVAKLKENINTTTNNDQNFNDNEVFTDPSKNNTTLLVSKKCFTDLKESGQTKNIETTTTNGNHDVFIDQRKNNTIALVSKYCPTEMSQYERLDNDEIATSTEFHDVFKTPWNKRTTGQVSESYLTNIQQYEQTTNIKSTTTGNDSVNALICVPEIKKKSTPKQQLFQQLNRNQKRVNKTTTKLLKRFSKLKLKGGKLQDKSFIPATNAVCLVTTGLKQCDSSLHCNKCQKTFENIKSLIHHKQILHYSNRKRIVLACANGCNKVFHNKKARRLHMRYMCYGTAFNILSKATTNKQRVATTAVKQTPSKCKSIVNNNSHKITKKQSKKKTVINSNLTKTTGELIKSVSFICTFCQKEFQSKKHLNQHSVTHENSKFKCTLCEKIFQRKHGLEQHIRVLHMGIRPFKCNVCLRPFSFRHDMLKCKHKKKLSTISS